MTDHSDFELDQKLTALGQEFSSKVIVLSVFDRSQDRLIKDALSDAVWALFFDFPEQREAIRTHLSDLAMAVFQADRPFLFEPISHRDM